MNSYLIFKALHLIAVISWMAGLLYLPRIFVYHSETNKIEVQETFKVMEKRLFLYIMNPAMILSWLFGFLLIHSIGLQSLKELWVVAKLILVVSLTFYHFFLFNCLKKFNINRNDYSPKFFRIINEVPTVLLIVIIFLVVFKPI
ncbi:MAG: TIGR00701 family protein [Candidatus Marinimicrobia bacterium]|nr:TIGR00701 family protein [Candidatus Neomarinimicrobiota bacterium]RPG06009.1 MAG: protoporphyrinogen oxidase HemJ [Pelagibacteraceae bacterium TMED247]